MTDTVEHRFQIPPRPMATFRGTEPWMVGRTQSYFVVSYTPLFSLDEASPGKVTLYRCDICMCVIAVCDEEDPSYIDGDIRRETGEDKPVNALNRHTKWHKAMLMELQNRR